MSRLFVIALIIFLIIFFFKRKNLPKNPLNSPKKTKKATSKAGEPMVKCKTCGVHLPISEALTRKDEFFCNAAHLTPE